MAQWMRVIILMLEEKAGVRMECLILILLHSSSLIWMRASPSQGSWLTNSRHQLQYHKDLDRGMTGSLTPVGEGVCLCIMSCSVYVEVGILIKIQSNYKKNL